MIEYLVKQWKNVVNKAYLFEEDFRRDNGKAHAKKIVEIMCTYNTTIMKTQGLMRKLLELQPPILMMVPSSPGSPSVIVEKLDGISAEPGQTEFTRPMLMERGMVRSP